VIYESILLAIELLSLPIRPNKSVSVIVSAGHTDKYSSLRLLSVQIRTDKWNTLNLLSVRIHTDIRNTLLSCRIASVTMLLSILLYQNVVLTHTNLPPLCKTNLCDYKKCLLSEQ